MDFSPVMNFVVARAKEPSTYAGIAAALTAFGVSVPPGVIQAVALLVGATSGAAAVTMKG